MTLIIFYMSLKSGKCNKCFRKEHIKVRNTFVIFTRLKISNTIKKPKQVYINYSQRSCLLNWPSEKNIQVNWPTGKTPTST